MTNTSPTRKYIAIAAGILLFLALVMIAAPLAQAKAAQMAARPPDVLQAEAEWFRARGEFYAALPETLQSGGVAVIQASYSLLLGSLGVAIGLLMLSASISFLAKAVRQELSKLAEHGFVTGREHKDGTTSQFFIVNPDTAVERYLLSRGAGVAYPTNPVLRATTGKHSDGLSDAARTENPRDWHGVIFDTDDDSARPGAGDNPDIRFNRRKI